MEFYSAKNDTEKIIAIKDYCNSMIKSLNVHIDWLIASKESPLDYSDEIHDLELIKQRFEDIIELTNISPLESKLLHASW